MGGKKRRELAQELGGREGWLVLSYLEGRGIGELMASGEEEAEPEVTASFEAIKKKREGGYPLQYALGIWNFYGRDFRVDPRALIPRPETELLVEQALTLSLGGKKVLELGTGTGVIPITLYLEMTAGGEEGPALLTATDLSSSALALARENAGRLLPPGGGKSPIQWIESDLFDKIKENYDLILSNPPYVGEEDREGLAEELSYEPSLALFSGWDGLDLIRRLIQEAPAYLNGGGWLLLEIGDRQGEAVFRLLEDRGFQQVKIRKDYTGRSRIALGQWPERSDCV